MPLISPVADAAELYQRYHRLVFTYLLRLSGSRETAEDLLQETFYRAIRGAAAFRGDASPANWLCRIAYRLYLNQAKSRGKEGQRRMEADLTLLADPAAGPESGALRQELRAEIAAVLAEMPETQRLALLLRDGDGLTYEEIADMLGLSLANVKVTIHRARARFRALYLERKEWD